MHNRALSYVYSCDSIRGGVFQIDHTATARVCIYVYPSMDLPAAAAGKVENAVDFRSLYTTYRFAREFRRSLEMKGAK